MRELSFYEVKFTDKAPVIDGKLEDECWKNAMPYSTYYEYFKGNPGLSPMKTEFRMLYDSRGIYLSIVNHEKNPENIRKKITDRDNPLLWTDDSSELYFDSHADGIGYYKFVINALGTMGDMRRIDQAVLLPDWNGNGWLASTAVNKDNWTIEAFFPWEDLGGKAQGGDLWMFCHVRFSYGEGKFCGATSSAGGNYSSTGNFGYILFQNPGQPISPEDIGKLLARKISPPWGLFFKNVMVFDSGVGLQLSTVAELLQGENDVIKQLIQDVENCKWSKGAKTYQKEINELKLQYQNIKPVFEEKIVYRSLLDIREKLDILNWKVKLDTLFSL